MFRPGWSRFRSPMLAASMALAGFAASLGLAASVWAGSQFLSITEDVPLMPGLAESAETATVFDKPAGRIATTEAVGPVTASAVKRFYVETLPQLGWQVLAPDLFRREAERLRLSFSGRDGTALTVRFELLPNQ